jgi:16S rRNA (guanine527-N7)-methyltransferase
VRLLLAWNAAINLTAIRDPAEIAVRHVADSLVGLTALREHAADRFVDLGSGGGFPAIPLAAALRPERVLLVESIAKKARFLDAAVAAIGLGGRVRPMGVRAEALARDGGQRGRWPAVTARAVASLAELVELALPLLRPAGVLIAWKSGDPDEAGGLGAELDAARRACAAIGDGEVRVGPTIAELVDRSERRSAVASIADHRLVTVARGRRPIASTWPRDPAARRRHPL